MALNQDPILLTLAELNQYRDLSLNLDTTRLDQSVRESQVDELNAFLGEELYLLFIEDWDGTSFVTQKFVDLWEGVDYINNSKSIRYYGLQPAIALYSYSRMLDNLQLNATRSGAVKFTDEESEPTEQPQISSKVKSARGQALVYLARADKFLNEKKADYPEYQTKESEVINKFSLKFFKVGNREDRITHINHRRTWRL